MKSYQCMLWIILICLNASTHRITSNNSTRTKNPGHRAAYTYGTSDRAENPYSQDTNTCWSRRSHRGRHTRDQALHTTETLIICEETQSTNGLQSCGQQLNEQIKTDRQQPTFSGKSPNPFTHMNLYKHVIGPTIDEDTTRISSWKANGKENKTTLEGAMGHSLITTAAPKNSLKIEAMWYTKNRVESVEEKGHTVKTLQQHEKVKNLVPQQHQRVKNLAPQVQQSGTWRNTPHQKAYSPGTQRYQNKNRNRIGNRKKKRTTSAKAHLQTTANTQKPVQERDQHSDTKNRSRQQSSSKPVRSSNTRSRDSRAGNFLSDTWKRNLRWSTKTPELVPDQLQPSPAIPGKFSHSPACIIPSTCIRSLLFFSNNHLNKKNRSETSYRKQDQLTMQNKRKKIELVKQRPWRIMEVEAHSQSNNRVPAKTRQKSRRPKTSKILIIDNN